MSIKDVITAFSEEQVDRLTGLSKAQLRYWDRTGFFAPKFAEEAARAHVAESSNAAKATFIFLPFPAGALQSSPPLRR
jgi:hypothetical protein